MSRCPCCHGSRTQLVGNYRRATPQIEIEYRDVVVLCPACDGRGTLNDRERPEPMPKRSGEMVN